MQHDRAKELLLQALETERVDADVYRTALTCVVPEEVEREWRKQLRHTQAHASLLAEVVEVLGIDPSEDSPARESCRRQARTWMHSIALAHSSGDPIAAPLAAAECIVLLKTRSHRTWMLLGEIAGACDGERGRVLREICSQIETQEEAQLLHACDWSRQLWIECLELRPSSDAPPRTMRSKRRRNDLVSEAW